jgi:hypothetical protein
MFSISPFSVDTFSSLGISSIKAVSLIEAIATIEASASMDLGASSTIQGAAILTSDGTLKIGGSSAELNAVVDILANATLRGSDAEIFIWTAPERSTTWSFPEVYSGSKLIWIIPSDVGGSTWVVPK